MLLFILRVYIPFSALYLFFNSHGYNSGYSCCSDKWPILFLHPAKPLASVIPGGSDSAG